MITASKKCSGLDWLMMAILVNETGRSSISMRLRKTCVQTPMVNICLAFTNIFGVHLSEPNPFISVGRYFNLSIIIKRTFEWCVPWHFLRHIPIARCHEGIAIENLPLTKVNWTNWHVVLIIDWEWVFEDDMKLQLFAKHNDVKQKTSADFALTKVLVGTWESHTTRKVPLQHRCNSFKVGNSGICKGQWLVKNRCAWWVWKFMNRLIFRKAIWALW